MKKLIYQLFIATGMLIYVSCTNTNARYFDLNTGEKVSLEKDPGTGLMVNPATRKPVEIYVDTKSHDTIYGTTGKVINGYVYKDGEGKYYYTAEDHNTGSEDYKKKVEKDGDVKIKNGDTKVKIEEGEKKVKKD